MKKHQGFTLIELLVVISIIALLISILLPALTAARKTARQIMSNTQLRGMHQGMVTFAQGNNSYFPGIQSSGDQWVARTDNLSGLYGGTVQARFALLVEEGFFSPEYAIHPAEPDVRVKHEPYDLGSGNVFDVEHYSYAMLAIAVENNPTETRMKPNQGDIVRTEWRDNLGSQSIMLSDRLIGWAPPGPQLLEGLEGVWSVSEGDAKWGVVWNDNHTTFESTPLFETRYGRFHNSADNLYSRGLTVNGNVQSPSAAPSPNDGGNAFMPSNDALGLLQQ